MSPLDRVQISLETELIDRARLLAEFKYVSAAAIVRMALKEFLDRRESIEKAKETRETRETK